MEKRLKLSKLLQVGLLLTFLLPFFPPSCEYKQAVEVSSADSKVIAVDTLRKESSKQTNENNQTDTLKSATAVNTTPKDKNKETIADDGSSARLAQKSPILKLILRPNGNYSGMGCLIESCSMVAFGYGLGIAFILWIIGLIIKLKDFNNIFLLINTLGLVFLSVSHSLYLFSDKRLWGYWVCIVWSAVMIIYDCYILFKVRKP